MLNKKFKETTHLPVKVPYGCTVNNVCIFFMELALHLGQYHYPPFVC